MRSFLKSLIFNVTFAFSFLTHFSNGQFDLDTNGDEAKVPKIEHEKTPVREMWFETSKGNNITLSCPKLPGSPPAVIEVHQPMTANPGLDRKLIVSTSGQLRLHNVTYDDAKTYYCSYFSQAPIMPTAKIHLNVYDVFSYMRLSRSRRSASASAAAAPAHKVDHSRKTHSSHSHQTSHDSAKNTKASPDHEHEHEHDHEKDKGKEKEPTAAATAVDKAKEAEKKPKEDHEMKHAQDEKDANENYDDDGGNSDVIEPPSSPDITQISENSVRLKWTSGSLRDRGVKGYKVEYLKGNLTKILGGMHGWHTVANKVRPKFRIFVVNDLEPDMSYRFRIATIYAGNKYIYGLSSGWVRLQRWS